MNKFISLKTLLLFFIYPAFNLNEFYWGHQCPWTLTLANSMQVSNMRSDSRTKK